MTRTQRKSKHMQRLSWVLNATKQKVLGLMWDKTADTSDVTFPKLEVDPKKERYPSEVSIVLQPSWFSIANFVG